MKKIISTVIVVTMILGLCLVWTNCAYAQTRTYANMHDHMPKSVVGTVCYKEKLGDGYIAYDVKDDTQKYRYFCDIVVKSSKEEFNVGDKVWVSCINEEAITMTSMDNMPVWLDTTCVTRQKCKVARVTWDCDAYNVTINYNNKELHYWSDDENRPNVWAWIYDDGEHIVLFDVE